MAATFRTSVEDDGLHLTLVERSFLRGERSLPRREWEGHAERRVLRALEALVDGGRATDTASEVLIAPDAAAGLPGEICDAIGLPPLAKLGLAIGLEGRVETPEGRLHLRWTDAAGRPVHPRRTGCLLEWGLQRGRLSAPLFRVAEAAEAYNRTFGQPFEGRIAAWMPVQDALGAATGASITRDGFLETFTLYQAGSFGLDVHESDDFTPILMSRSRAPSLEDEAPAEEIADGFRDDAEPFDGGPVPHLSENLLPADDHREFVRAFSTGAPTRDAYRVGRNRFVLIDPSLKRALDVVKAKRRGGIEERREFLRNPRAAIAEAIDPAGADAPAATLFVETEGYSDRVTGLGLWERPKIPWLIRKPNEWLPESGWTADGEPVEAPLKTEAEIAEIERAYEDAEIRGDTHLTIDGVPVPIDAAPRVISELKERAAEAAGSAVPGPAGESGEPAPRLVLLIDKKTNFDGVDYQIALTPRPALVVDEPKHQLMGSDPLKPHQLEGFGWLVEAWRSGWPGVLLADDMGLGKTFQALAFMAWLKSNAAAASERGRGSVAQGPMLIVAPTALLRNWEKECADRLAPDALGERVAAYGRELGKLKLDPARRSDPGETLDRGRLKEADWILTTYETLTDHERAFGPISYSLVIFDEMQKVKAPDTLNTKAAKALNADFVLGLTGTPIENRMEDLWCLFDRLAPGYLQDLKSFSATYREDQPDKLRALKRMLDQPTSAAPPIMKRRMKADILVGLPRKEERCYRTEMPPEQAAAYRSLVTEALKHRERSPGFMLKVLHGMRGLSLHPLDAAVVDVSSAAAFEAFAWRSARLKATVEILRKIREAGEKALLFVEFLGMQDAVAEGLAALFDLPRRPSIINGSVPGEKRLEIVNAFQNAGPGFGLLVLSPRAAGVGLNITAANHVVHLSRWWNPAVEDQCNDRAHRIGQTKPVTVHIPIATHPGFPAASFDERLHLLLERKRILSREMLAPPTSDSDIAELFGGTVPG